MKQFRPDIMHVFNKIRALSIAAGVALFCAAPVCAKPGDKILNRPYADQKRWHFGFSVGTQFQDLNFTHNGYETPAPENGQWFVEIPSYAPGICANVLADLRLHSHFNLRFSPGMYFGSKSVEMVDANSDARLRQEIKTAYVVLPFDLKISGERYYNSRPYVTVGAMGAFDVGKKRSDYLQFNSADTLLTDFHRHVCRRKKTSRGILDTDPLHSCSSSYTHEVNFSGRTGIIISRYRPVLRKLHVILCRHTCRMQ